ncbi:biotin/lipoyl-containing protein [Trichococcus shcherbakoviae]|uniref:Biotin/lipoyl-binding protein n=1 Tax=Trichococcus shcherbakoviae subsp. psychrophilus TaxID=2585775 RepID=A0A5C5E5P5_9LACT|nr:biotin/lipoyl-containing protein [Trichococcus shcherbakoviae]TNV67940.1 biotin/lipoyl-binding protein [Trichococcus shcherbakoviae subsp. psychrophilus]TNV69553.1 biotin/lipoyl-binding protein [Trichococcus shcherbakoviae subsp. psychrophilus]
MKNYEIEIDGQVYHVKVRELPDDAVMTEQPKADSGRHVADSATQTEGKTMLAPMAGTILRILVKEGQRVKKGENLIVLEAMKMENEIVADEDGVISSILVKANDSVESDQPLLIL